MAAKTPLRSSRDGPRRIRRGASTPDARRRSSSALPYRAATGLHRWWVATRRVGCGPTWKSRKAARPPSRPRPEAVSAVTGRITNLALLFLLALAFASGWMAFELSGQPARAVLLLHAAAGVAIVLLVPWKSLVAKRGFRRPRSLKWASVVLGIGVAISIVFGLVHASGHPNLSEGRPARRVGGARGCLAAVGAARSHRVVPVRSAARDVVVFRQGAHRGHCHLASGGGK